jgi:hypothetical protein
MPGHHALPRILAAAALRHHGLAKGGRSHKRTVARSHGHRTGAHPARPAPGRRSATRRETGATRVRSSATARVATSLSCSRRRGKRGPRGWHRSPGAGHGGTGHRGRSGPSRAALTGLSGRLPGRGRVTSDTSASPAPSRAAGRRSHRRPGTASPQAARPRRQSQHLSCSRRWHPGPARCPAACLHAARTVSVRRPPRRGRQPATSPGTVNGPAAWRKTGTRAEQRALGTRHRVEAPPCPASAGASGHAARTGLRAGVTAGKLGTSRSGRLPGRAWS